MNEKEWVEILAECINEQCLCQIQDGDYSAVVGMKLAYGHEIRGYGNEPVRRTTKYETDILIREFDADGVWKPRIVIECKVHSVTTHDSITYSQKASAHKSVHPYLRYGIMLGCRKHRPLPGRLYRHGESFDFMMSFQGYELAEPEIAFLRDLIADEISASQTLEKIIYESRKRGRDHYTLLHRKLVVHTPNFPED
ncbi:hypothetical protein SV7mr_49340 [Stieleria bergensis]|uniref:Uncharacterized protein n=1 Tax=Stieleria bergensis TaxID=2528025 RepID=A0A517T1Z1_9BACT|nr:hypothetical protein SV7mr_49340 [Planctomycetes bacterium SV_7m_r]